MSSRVERHPNILYLDDSFNDAELVQAAVTASALKVEINHVDSKEAFLLALEGASFDLILLDYNVPGFDAPEAIKTLKEKQICAPIIIVTGSLGDEVAVEIMKEGVFDYVLKNNLSRLATAIERGIKDHKEKEKQAEREKIYKQIIKLAQAGMFITNIHGEYIYVNKQLMEMFGTVKENLLGNGWANFLEPDVREEMLEKYKASLVERKPFQFEAPFVSQTGKTVWVLYSCTPNFSGDELINYVGTQIDITELKETQEKLKKIARYDLLTDLPNRRLFEDTLSGTLQQFNRDELPSFAVVYLDIDNFKKINDSLGHAAGDALLKLVADRFRETLRKHDFIARLAGDEFVIISPSTKSPRQIALLAERLIEAFKQPFYFEDHTLKSSVSIGICYIDKTRKDITIEEILKRADLALYRAKDKGKSCYMFYTEGINQEVIFSISVENQLRNAIKNNEFSLVYQPQVEAVSGQLLGCEALLRWDNEVHPNITPDVFIPLAEEGCYMTEIGKWIVQNSLEQLAHWKKNHSHHLPNEFVLSINISPKQLSNDKTFVKFLKEKIKEYDINPSMLALEVTETTILENMLEVKNIFDELVNVGLRISIDDFGTGYSSLSHLKDLPVKTLKIDKSFVQEIETSENCRVITKSIISLARAMNLGVLAEGVETDVQLEFLKKHGCSHVQGYYYSKPLLPEKFIEMVGAEKS